MEKKKTYNNKNKNQITQYKQSLKTNYNCKSTDDYENFSLLQGSNDDNNQSDNVQNNKNVAKGIKRQKLKKFLKEHVFETIVSIVLAIVVSIASWMITNLISVKEELAVFSYRVDKIEEDILDIETDMVTKEFLEKELQIIKLEIETASEKDLAQLELRISLLENQLANLKNN